MNHNRPAAPTAASSGNNVTNSAAQKSAENSAHPLLDSLLLLRDEIRLHMHLANMEAREQWKLLERELHSASNLVNMAKADRHVVLHELRIRVERFARNLGQPDPH